MRGIRICSASDGCLNESDEGGPVGPGAGRRHWAVLARNAEEIARRAGRRIEVSRIAAWRCGPRRSRVGDGEISTDGALVRDPAVDIVGRIDRRRYAGARAGARSHCPGRHVVTANKALLAAHGQRDLRRRSARGVMVAFRLRFGLQFIIKAIREGLTANCIEWVAASSSN